MSRSTDWAIPAHKIQQRLLTEQCLILEDLSLRERSECYWIGGSKPEMPSLDDDGNNILRNIGKHVTYKKTWILSNAAGRNPNISLFKYYDVVSILFPRCSTL